MRISGGNQVQPEYRTNFCSQGWFAPGTQASALFFIYTLSVVIWPVLSFMACSHSADSKICIFRLGLCAELQSPDLVAYITPPNRYLEASGINIHWFCPLIYIQSFSKSCWLYIENISLSAMTATILFQTFVSLSSLDYVTLLTNLPVSITHSPSSAQQPVIFVVVFLVVVTGQGVSENFISGHDITHSITYNQETFFFYMKNATSSSYPWNSLVFPSAHYQDAVHLKRWMAHEKLL